MFLAITLPIATLVMVPSWAGPAEDKTLWDAAGCRGGHLDTEAVKAALKLGADPSAPSKTARPITPLGCVSMARAGTHDDTVNREAVEVAKILFAAGAKLGPADREILLLPVARGNVENGALANRQGGLPRGEAGRFHPNRTRQAQTRLGAAGIEDGGYHWGERRRSYIFFARVSLGIFRRNLRDRR
jgi:hypothetical protein